jgi:hypothetical protein
MHKITTRFLFATIGIAICGFSTWATAQSESTASMRCPAGYWQMQSLCFSDATGDVVNAEPAGASRVAFESGCAPAYWRLAEICLGPATGDVELVAETRAGLRAEAHN